MTLTKFHDFLKNLSEGRPVFHSEADFKHAFAWHIHEAEPDLLEIRLEFKPFHDENMYMDIWLRDKEGMATAIELKYRTRGLEAEWEGEMFALRSQSAQDTGRYGFVKDISRLERVVCGLESVKAGFAIFLTNDPSYWSSPQRKWKDTNDAAFRIHEGVVIEGEMNWS